MTVRDVIDAEDDPRPGRKGKLRARPAPEASPPETGRSHTELPKCPETGKLSHPDFLSAAKHAKRLGRDEPRGVKEIRCYQCPHCRAWHVGHR